MRDTRSGSIAYSKRYHLLDSIRGLTLISMICYHGAWDLVYIAGVDWPWYHSMGAYWWQQSICWTFILLSGLCMTLSAHPYRRGAEVFGSGLLVTAVTILFLPEDRVVFGVLTFLGSAMLITALLQRWLERVHAAAGLAVCAYLFFLFRPVNEGYLQIVPGVSAALPEALYHGLPATYLGFMESGFYSTDYFSVLPWLFLFWCGLYLGLLLVVGRGTDGGAIQKGSRPERGAAEDISRQQDLREEDSRGSAAAAGRSPDILYLNIHPLSFLGRHSLLIYLLHQPVLYLLISLCGMAGI